ncbi:MAG: hypothetical protein E3J60_04630 [Dehalococcoidia bacterium]|nr:MAG: hypothetical protein E3J60_04630 [Dehalococcoidia bacterium]
MSRKNLRELRGDTRSMLGPDTQHIPDSVLDVELNKAQRTLNARFEIVESSWYATSVADQCLYKLPLALLRLGRVYFDDTLIHYTQRKSLTGVESDLEDIQTPTWTEET